MLKSILHSIVDFIIISVYGSPLESTTTFKYLGLTIASDLSWTTHIDNICSQGKRMLGLVYWRFYKHSDMKTLHQLYVSLVWPQLEYAAAVWSPHLQKDIGSVFCWPIHFSYAHSAKENSTWAMLSCFLLLEWPDSSENMSLYSSFIYLFGTWEEEN